MTLYVPGPVLREGANEIVLLEVERPARDAAGAPPSRPVLLPSHMPACRPHASTPQPTRSRVGRHARLLGAFWASWGQWRRCHTPRPLAVHRPQAHCQRCVIGARVRRPTRCRRPSTQPTSGPQVTAQLLALLVPAVFLHLQFCNASPCCKVCLLRAM